jgi:hypothetical protein
MTVGRRNCALQTTDNTGEARLPSVRRGEVTKRQRTASAALASDAEPQMGEVGEAGRPWHRAGERRRRRRQRRRPLGDIAHLRGFGALTFGKHAGATACQKSRGDGALHLLSIRNKMFVPVRFEKFYGRFD